ncbi:hypothetical protein HYH02_004794 [Chlamydomonas schloesseri]|uniref:Uncharacterized protein n=1 Tax=Chlamydomonas schloesseri TaxID=2026947 RepID=A0A835WNS1_9CHLO|nr:hypothetical protein HYH02_004794 [Chlamydomonas schloesseri]|eukprot:KAG2450286.1 hypothetical protein HYH02_004794 [Chlamydomonas schloesseri]
MASNKLGGQAFSQPAPDDDWAVSDKFCCERVCVTDKLVGKVGGPAKDATKGNCVTVCGVSAQDACTDACARAVCVSASHVPAWNDACIRRCNAECLRTKQQQGAAAPVPPTQQQQ